MNTTIKKACIFALAQGAGLLVTGNVHKIATLTGAEKEILTEHAIALREAGEKAMAGMHGRFDNSLVRRVHNRVDAALTQHGEHFDLTEAISLLFLGVQDLMHFCQNQPGLEDLEGATLNLMTTWDPNLENDDTHTAARRQYEKWING